MIEIHSHIRIPFSAKCKDTCTISHISVLYELLAVQALVLHFFMATCGEEELVMSEKWSQSAKSLADMGRLCTTVHTGSGYFESSRQTNLLQVEEHVHHPSDKNMAICLTFLY